jgi:hypothetical protein
MKLKLKLLKKIINKLGFINVNEEITGYEIFIGKDIFIRTITHHYTGRVISTTKMTMTLNNAAWIADDGRFSESMKDSNKLEEVEMYTNPVVINLYSILDCTLLSGPLPQETK